MVGVAAGGMVAAAALVVIAGEYNRIFQCEWKGEILKLCMCVFLGECGLSCMSCAQRDSLNGHLV